MLSLHPPCDLTSQLTGIDPCLKSDPIRPRPPPIPALPTPHHNLIGGFQTSKLIPAQSDCSDTSEVTGSAGVPVPLPSVQPNRSLPPCLFTFPRRFPGTSNLSASRISCCVLRRTTCFLDVALADWIRPTPGGQ